MIDRPQPHFTPDELRQAQDDLGLSDADLSHVLGLGDAQHVRRLKAPEGSGHHRPVKPWHARLLRAYLDGYRPADWPEGPRRKRRISDLPRDDPDQPIEGSISDE